MTTRLTLVQRAIARDRGVQALILALHHAPQVHYTQGSQRWEGIDHHLVARRGEYPRHADCSAMFSWAIYQGVHLGLGLGDIVNGENWEGGWTGTLARHGREVLHESHLLPMDAVLYGRGPNYDHVAAIVRRRKSDNKPLVISHGSENGPYLLPFDYRPDVGEFRRYILKEV